MRRARLGGDPGWPRCPQAITFASKRAFHTFLRITRKPLRSLSPGLTAARFDMLYVLWTGSGAEEFFAGKATQRDVRRALGVSASVVSRMLQALEELGWVQRERCRVDRRQRVVKLTEAGVACIRAAHQALRRAMGKLVVRAICHGRHRKQRPHPDASQRFVHMETLESYLRALTKRWGDTAGLYYA